MLWRKRYVRPSRQPLRWAKVESLRPIILLNKRGLLNKESESFISENRPPSENLTFALGLQFSNYELRI